tara:strand:- start:6480 stop:6899 length:420 start_codon:yes stop_codon:yes gene_type:complete
MYFYDVYGNFKSYENFDIEINKIFTWNNSNYIITNINQNFNDIRKIGLKLLDVNELPNKHSTYFKNQNILSLFLFCEKYSESVNNLGAILIFPSKQNYTKVYRDEHYNFVIEEIYDNYFSKNKIEESKFGKNLYLILKK